MIKPPEIFVLFKNVTVNRKNVYGVRKTYF